MAIKIDNAQNKLIINTIKIIDENNKSIDIKRLFKTLEIVESIDSMFYYGRLILNDENYIDEEIPINGMQKIRISWKTENNSVLRDYTFHITSIPEITRIREPLMNEIVIDFIHEDYVKLISGRYNKSYINTTSSSIVSDILSEKGVSLSPVIETSAEQISMYNCIKSSLSFIDDVRFETSTPYVFFQRHNEIFFKSWKSLFSQSEVIPLSTKIATDKVSEIGYMISDVRKNDVFDVLDIQLDGVNGYQHLDIDLENKSVEINDVTLDEYINRYSPKRINKKITHSDDYNNLNLSKDSRFIEDYIKMAMIECKIPYSNSDIFVGDMVSIQFAQGQEKISFSKYSGNWVIFEIHHQINSSLQYTSNLILVKNSFFK